MSYSRVMCVAGLSMAWSTISRLSGKLLLAALLVSLGACGGGGGGSGNGSTTTRLSVSSVSGTTSELYDSQNIPSVNILFRVTGDLTIFKTEPLVLLIELSDLDLFESVPSISVSSDNQGGNVGLTGKLWKGGPTTRTGNIILHACLGLSCSRELPIDGGTIPYNITIRSGVTVPVASVDLTAPFGSFPAERVIPVTLPDGAIGWSVSQFFGIDAVSARKAADGSNNLIVSQAVATPAGYSNTEEVVIRAETPDHQTIGTSLTVNLSTTPSAVPFVFRNAHPSFSMTQGQATISNSLDATLLLQTPSVNTVRYTGMIFTAWPVEATDPVLRESWMDPFMAMGSIGPTFAANQFPLSIRVMACNGFGCLPAGTYTANLNFEYTPPEGGAATPATLPVTMIVTPAP